MGIPQTLNPKPLNPGPYTLRLEPGRGGLGAVGRRGVGGPAPAADFLRRGALTEVFRVPFRVPLVYGRENIRYRV